MAVDGMVGSLFCRCMVRYMAVFSSANVDYAADTACACTDDPDLLSACNHEGECYTKTAGGGVKSADKMVSTVLLRRLCNAT